MHFIGVWSVVADIRSANANPFRPPIEASMQKRPFVSPVSKDEMKSEVEEKLRKQQLTRPLTEKEMTAFCQAMVKNLELKSNSALSDIRGWAQSWQTTWLRSPRG
jgi:hypothetical protein